MHFTKLFAFIGLGAFAMATPVDGTTTNVLDACDRNSPSTYDFRRCEDARLDKQRDRDRLDRDRGKLDNARDQYNWDLRNGAPRGVLENDRDKINRDRDRIDRDRGNIQNDKARQCANMYPRPDWCY